MSLNQALSVAQRLLAGPGGAEAALSFLLGQGAPFAADASYWSAVAYLHTLCGHSEEAADAFKKAGELRVRGDSVEGSGEVRRMGRPSGVLGIGEEERKQTTNALEARNGEGGEGACFGSKRGSWRRRELFGIMDSLKRKAERFLGRKGVEQGRESGPQGVREEMSIVDEEKEAEELSMLPELGDAASGGPSVAGLMGRMRSLRLMGDNIVSAAAIDRELRKENVGERERRTKRKENIDTRTWPLCSKTPSGKWRNSDSDSDSESFDEDLNRGGSGGSSRTYRERKPLMRNTSLEPEVTGPSQGSVGINHTTHKNYVGPVRLAGAPGSPLQRPRSKFSRSNGVLTSVVLGESSEAVQATVSTVRPSEEYCSDLDDDYCWSDYCDSFSEASECSFPCCAEDYRVRRTAATSSLETNFQPPAGCEASGRSTRNNRGSTTDENRGVRSPPDRTRQLPSGSVPENRKPPSDESPHAVWDFSGISDLCSDGESFGSSDHDDVHGIWSALEEDEDSDDESEVSNAQECLPSQVGDSDSGEFVDDQDFEEDQCSCRSDCDHFADSEQGPESVPGMSDSEISAQLLRYFLDSDSEEELGDAQGSSHEENHPVSGPPPDNFPHSRLGSDRDQERASLRRVNSAPSLSVAASEAGSDFHRHYEAEEPEIPESYWIEDDDDAEGHGIVPQYYEFVSGHLVEVFEDSRGFFYRFSTEADISDFEDMSDFEDESDSEGIEPKMIDEIAPKMSLDRRDPKATDSCVICYEPLGTKRIRTLPCSEKHCYHAKCIDRWLESNVTCPNCRVDLRWSEPALTSMRANARGRHAGMERDAL